MTCGPRWRRSKTCWGTSNAPLASPTRRNRSAAPAAPAKRGPGRPRKVQAGAAPAAKAPKAKRGKRSTADVSATAGKLVEYIAKNPGQSIEQIGKGMNIHTKHLKLPAKKLLEDKKLKTTGQRRGTKYFVK
jgi:hypothetical protein